MSINVSSNFRLYAQLPLDSRQAVADTTARDAIPSGERFDGLAVYCVSDNITYQLQGDITNSDWVEVYGSGGDLWDRIGTVLTPHTSGDSVTGYDYRTTKVIGSSIGPNLWTVDPSIEIWSDPATPTHFGIIDFGGVGAQVAQELAEYHSAPGYTGVTSAKLTGSAAPTGRYLYRAITGQTPGTGFGIALWLKRAAAVSTDMQFLIFDNPLNPPTVPTQIWAHEGFNIAITHFADAGGGSVLVTAPSHTIVTPGLSVTITDTTNYNGTYTITAIGEGTFTITATWAADDATGFASAKADGTGAWIPFSMMDMATKTTTLSTDLWVNEGVTFTVPATGNIYFVPMCEDSKSLYIDDFIAAVFTITTGTVFDFTNASSASDITSLDKIFNFGTTGGTAKNYLWMTGDGKFGTDWTTFDFTSKDFTGDDGYFTKVQSGLFTNTIVGGNDDFILDFIDLTDRAHYMTNMQLGSMLTPITTNAMAMNRLSILASGYGISVDDITVTSGGMTSNDTIIGSKVAMFGDATDTLGTTVVGYKAEVGSTHAGLAATVSFLSDHSLTTHPTYDFATLYGNMNIAALLGYGGTGDGLNITYTACDAGMEGCGGSHIFNCGDAATATASTRDGGYYEISLGNSAGSGAIGTFRLKLGTSQFMAIQTDDQGAVIETSYTTDDANAIAFQFYATNDLTTSGAKLATWGDNAATSASEKVAIYKDGQVYSGYHTNDLNYYPHAQGVFVFSDSTIGGWPYNAGVIGEAAADASHPGAGVVGFGMAHAANKAWAGYFETSVSETGIGTDAIGIEVSAQAAHVGGRNIAVIGNANGGLTNYSWWSDVGVMQQIGFLNCGAFANMASFTDAQGVFSRGDTGIDLVGPIGVVGEAVSDGSNYATGVAGIGQTNGTQSCFAGYFVGKVTATGDTGSARAIQGVAIATHAGGSNIAVYGDANNGDTNYSFYGLHGTLHNEDIATFGAASNITDFPLAHLFSSTGNTTYTLPGHVGVVGEALAVNSGTVGVGFGVVGVGKGADSYGAFGGYFIGMVGATADGATVTGVHAESNYAHSGGSNVAVYASASNSDVENYSFYGANGNHYNLGRMLGHQGANVTAANDITLGQGNYFYITGATQINRIAKAGWTAGSRFVLGFSQNPVINAGTAGDATYGRILTDTATDINTTVGCLVDVFYDGTDFKVTPLWNAS